MKRLAACFVVVGVLSGACSGGSPTGPDAFTDSRSGSVGASSVTVIQGASVDLTAPRAGTLTANLTWGSSSVDLDLFLTGTSCASETALIAGNCTILARSETSVGTSERITQSVSSGQAVRLWILNFSPAAQGFTVNVDIR